jgi:predicted permease
LATEAGDWGLQVEGYTPPPNQGTPGDWQVVTPGYFEALGMHLRAGRALQDTDAFGQPPVAVVSESFVRQFLPRVNPIGVRFKYAGMEPVNPVYTIVGVVGDIHFQSLTRAALPQVFVPLAQAPYRARYSFSVVARATDARRQPQVAAALRETLRRYDADVPADISSLETMVAGSVADRRLRLLLVAAFAGLALVLAATGIYSVLSQTVAQRTPEIGVRMALGADAAMVVRLVLWGALWPVLGGAAIGLGAAAAATRLLASFLYGVRPLDPTAFALAAAILVIVALIAAWLPAWRATRVDPLRALRAQ